MALWGIQDDPGLAVWLRRDFREWRKGLLGELGLGLFGLREAPPQEPGLRVWFRRSAGAGACVALG